MSEKWTTAVLSDNGWHSTEFPDYIMVTHTHAVLDGEWRKYVPEYKVEMMRCLCESMRYALESAEFNDGAYLRALDQTLRNVGVDVDDIMDKCDLERAIAEEDGERYSMGEVMEFVNDEFRAIEAEHGA